MKISSFDLNLFVILNAIYTEGSLTKAAEVVGITQPAVSNALACLLYTSPSPRDVEESRMPSSA